VLDSRMMDPEIEVSQLFALPWGYIEELGKDPTKEECLSPELSLRILSEFSLLGKKRGGSCMCCLGMLCLISDFDCWNLASRIT
jgi:hypothetical protein